MKKLESGITYKITDLFTDNRYIIIPDLQRDYCWGNKKHGDNNIDLVSGFIQSLNAIFMENQDRNIKLGMIYAYEFPKDSERIYLCDGQQRITTLYLLLGMLYRQTKNETIKNCLISEFELLDDQEPRLQYAIRESTLYFLSDLVCNFFLDNPEIEVAEIEKQSWYFKEYDLDPTIKSMLSALEIIDNKLKDFENLNSFSDFILKNIEFFYFDMNDRETGEDMFVVINTTGEPLTPTENIKPILIGSIDDLESQKEASDLWENWEKWFWENKLENEHEADNGLNDFFIFYWQIKLLQEKQWKGKKAFDINPFKLFSRIPKSDSNEEGALDLKLNDWDNFKSIPEIERYFEAYKKLSLEIKYENENQKVLSTINDKLNFDNFSFLRKLPTEVILPLIQFKVKFSEVSIIDFVRRIRKNYFDKKIEDRATNHVDWRHIIQLIDQATSLEQLFYFSDDKQFKVIPNVSNNIAKWYNIEEQLKTELKKENQNLIQNIEDHQDFMGDLSFFLFKVNNSEEKINCSILEKYYTNYTNTIDRIRNEDKSKPNLVNYIRLFLVINDCNKVGHIWRASWDFEGVLFSTITKDTTHLKDKDFQKLCSLEHENAIIDFCKKIILEKINENDFLKLEEDFSVEKFIKSWLILKVANAEKENVCISFYDGNETGVSAYVNKDDKRNRVLETEEFALGNAICGFGVRSGFGGGNCVHYTNKDLWLKPNIIDTPFSDVAYKIEHRTKEQIQLNEKKIDELKEFIFNWQNLILV